jgi:hypothetical protein
VVFDAGVRDLEGLDEIDGFCWFVRGVDPSYLKEVMMTCINCPIRIGRATVLPGDLVLGKKKVSYSSLRTWPKNNHHREFIALKDDFGHQRLREKEYTPGQIMTRPGQMRSKRLSEMDRRKSFEVAHAKKDLETFEGPNW